MDGTAAIEYNRQALKRILAAIVAMAGLGSWGQFTFFPRDDARRRDLALAEKSKLSPAPTLQRRLYLAVLSLLRPAESATRRLIIAMARGLTATPPPSRPRKAGDKIKVLPLIVRNGAGTGIVLPFGGPVPASLAHLVPPAAAARPLTFPLTDASRLWRGRRRLVVSTSIPRVGMPGVTERRAVPIRTPPAPDDPIDASRLGQRLEVLGRALDDLPAQARRFARWRARCDRSQGRGLIRRPSPLRLGRPPGGRLSRYDPLARRPRNVREVDEVLAHAHALAVYALEHPDTS